MGAPSFRRRFALQDFTIELNLNQDNAKTFPILSKFLAEEAQLRGLRHLPALLEFTSMLLARFSRRLDRESAARMTLGDVIRSAPDPAEWAAKFDGFCLAWNAAMPFAEKFGCLALPDVYKNVVAGAAMPLSFCLPAEKDEGICPMNLARFMGERHNAFVNAVDELLLLRGEELQRSALRQNVVSSRFFAPSQAIAYNLSAFVEHLEQQCVQLNESGQFVLDFASAERYLIDAFLGGKPVLELELRMMSYIASVSDEAGGVALDSDAHVGALKHKVKQEPLAADVQRALLKELASPSAARACLELIETSVSFLQETGGSVGALLNVGDKPLGEYISSVLLMSAEQVCTRRRICNGEFGIPSYHRFILFFCACVSVCFGSRQVRAKLGLSAANSAFATHVCLKHIVALHAALRDVLTADAFAQVLPKYKAPLDADHTAVLGSLAKQGALDVPALLTALKPFVQDNLAESFISERIAVKEVIGELEVDERALSDLAWWPAFPDSIRMSQIVALYHALKQVVTLN